MAATPRGVDEILDVDRSRGQPCPDRLGKRRKPTDVRARENLANREHGRAKQRKLDSLDWNVVSTVEVEELIAATLEQVQRRDAPGSTHVGPALSRRAVREADHGVRFQSQRLSLERRKLDHAVEGRLNETRRRGGVVAAVLEPTALEVHSQDGGKCIGEPLDSNSSKSREDRPVVDGRIGPQHVVAIASPTEAPWTTLRVRVGADALRTLEAAAKERLDFRGGPSPASGHGSLTARRTEVISDVVAGEQRCRAVEVVRPDPILVRERASLDAALHRRARADADAGRETRIDDAELRAIRDGRLDDQRRPGRCDDWTSGQRQTVRAVVIRKSDTVDVRPRYGGRRTVEERTVAKRVASAWHRDEVVCEVSKRHPRAHGRQRRLVDATAKRDGSTRHDRARMEMQISADNDHITVHRAIHRSVAAEDDHCFPIDAIAREDSLRRSRLDHEVRTRERPDEQRWAGAGPRVLQLHGDWNLRGGNPADEQQGDRPGAKVHFASSKKLRSSALPCGVMTDSGWNWTPYTGCSRCLTAWTSDGSSFATATISSDSGMVRRSTISEW